MFRGIAVGVLLPLLSAIPAQTVGLPTCRVRVVKSAEAESVSKSLVRQVEAWADSPERGSRLVPTIDEADVLLEIARYRPRRLNDGGLADEWLFVARRLSEPSRQRGTYRFGHLVAVDPMSQSRVAKQLPLVLADVCFGYLPKPASKR